MLIENKKISKTTGIKYLLPSVLILPFKAQFSFHLHSRVGYRLWESVPNLKYLSLVYQPSACLSCQPQVIWGRSVFRTVLWPPLWLCKLGPLILFQIVLWGSQAKDEEIEEDLSTHVSHFLLKKSQNQGSRWRWKRVWVGDKWWWKKIKLINSK